MKGAKVWEVALIVVIVGLLFWVPFRVSQLMSINVRRGGSLRERQPSPAASDRCMERNSSKSQAEYILFSSSKYSEERYTRKLSPPPSLHSPQKSPS